MSVRDPHVPLDRLTALALVGRAPESEPDRSALAHIAECRRCADKLARLSATSDAWRDAAFAEADAVFDGATVEAQRIRILDRLAHLGQLARVLPFPTRARDVSMPVAKGSHSWVSVAAAAGLIIGLVAGQLLHFVPTALARQPREQATMQSPTRSAPATIIPAATTAPLLSDDELLDEIEAAVQLRRAQSLRALDALTPTASEFRDWSLGR